MSKAATALFFSASKRHPEWDAIANCLSDIDTAAQKVELIGRSAVDNVHSENLTEVFTTLAVEIEDAVDRIKVLVGIEQPTAGKAVAL
jgi:hypothetical protein